MTDVFNTNDNNTDTADEVVEQQLHSTQETVISTATAATTNTTNVTGGQTSTDKVTIAKLSAQLKRLNEANMKYKNLLKLAKERIEKQEDEMNTIQQENAQLSERVLELEEKEALWALNTTTTTTTTTATSNGTTTTNDEFGDNSKNTASSLSAPLPPPGMETSIVRICQRVQNKVSSNNNDGKTSMEIWVLFEMQTTTEDGNHCRRYKGWKRFDTESQLQDYIRLETGEPIIVPPYVLSQEQSQQLQQQTEQQIMKINDEFRRFRVKAEMTRKQSESLIRELQSSYTQKVVAQQQQQQNGNDNLMNHNSIISSNMTESEQIRALVNQIEQFKKEMTVQESHFKQKYEALLAENNNILKSTTDEKRTKLSSLSIATNTNNNEYEAKYKDLKESFRLYRKKAKEIFEAQQQQSTQLGGVPSAMAMSIANHTSSSVDDAKLSYLKNLMINYFTADPSVRDHMLSAIGTVLQFTPDEQKRITATKKATQESTSWF